MLPELFVQVLCCKLLPFPSNCAFPVKCCMEYACEQGQT